MSVCLLLISDGREEYLECALGSLELCLPRFDATVHIDDSDHRLGFDGAIQEGWSQALDTGCDHCFHMEQDFSFNRPVPLDELVALVEDYPHLCEVTLRRQAVGAEVPHGGFMQMAPQWYEERSDERRSWVETTRNFSTNPSLYRTELCGIGWPDAPDSEGHFGFMVREAGLPWGVAGEDVRFGFWGSMENGAEWVHHLGEERAGVRY